MQEPPSGHLWKPGKSANPLGRPTGYAGLARYIKSQTSDYREMADILLAIARDSEHKDRLAAVAMLLDRGLGKPIQSIEMQAVLSRDGDEQRVALDFSKLSTDDLAKWHDLLGKLSSDPSKQSGPALPGSEQGVAQRRVIEHAPTQPPTAANVAAASPNHPPNGQSNKKANGK